MCGIFCLISEFSSDCEIKVSEVFKLLEKNIHNRGPDYISTYVHIEKDQYCLLFGASVLWLQGSDITEQPLETDVSVLVFNGDIFDGTKLCLERKSLEGDTRLFLEALENARGFTRDFPPLHGPYAFIYFDKINHKIYFARDIFGRRSLLIGKVENNLVLTSVATKTDGCHFIELPAIGIFSIDLKDDTFAVHLWYDQKTTPKLLELKSFLGRQIRVLNSFEAPKDCSFSEPSENDLAIFEQLKDKPVHDAFEVLLANKNWLGRVLQLKVLLENSVKFRVGTQPKYCQKCIKPRSKCKHSLIGVLFSGGIDCAILALLVDRYMDDGRPVDLLNVAFDRVKDFKTPDRITGLKTLEELRILCPKRQWNFVEINVTEKELNFERENIISHLIYPLNTVLDDSLGCALWFAARGRSDSYETPCRIVITGMGADELFGGYTRHRNVLKRTGWRGLNDSLLEEWHNIAYRNLGRDDRVVSDSSRQLRLPYLDENVVNFLSTLNCWEKSCPSSDFPQGFGEKILLRSLGYHLGLRDAACLKKRALQFGSKIANPKENANDISTRL